MQRTSCEKSLIGRATPRAFARIRGDYQGALRFGVLKLVQGGGLKRLSNYQRNDQTDNPQPLSTTPSNCLTIGAASGVD
jgi:hypothetical protein